MSLPRLELLAVVVNARLLTFVVDTLPMEVSSVVCWTDIMVALHCRVKGQSFRWKPFVTNRVAEKQSTWDPECWRYCTSKENPADLLTRGLSCGHMIASTYLMVEWTLVAVFERQTFTRSAPRWNCSL